MLWPVTKLKLAKFPSEEGRDPPSQSNIIAILKPGKFNDRPELETYLTAERNLQIFGKTYLQSNKLRNTRESASREGRLTTEQELCWLGSICNYFHRGRDPKSINRSHSSL